MSPLFRMQKILISLSAFSDKGNDEELTKIDLRSPAPVPNIDLDITPRVNLDEQDNDKHLADLNQHVAQATLEIGRRPDLHTRYQLRRVAQMSVRYENNTMPNENI